ncbi:MAG: hypothetical protein CFE21_10885 [Bacteroidetes bacterium B1(2017)]|nr:MAG: hypothetical protein CFE21_10885 [Bacteroidetes bacterium B1(2017)]
MAEKNLPIKFFEKRQKDEQDTEGGGGKLPEWVLKGEALSAKSRVLQSYLSKLSDKIKTKSASNNFLPTVFKARLSDDAIAKSHRGDLSKIFNVHNKLNVIGFTGENDILVKVDEENDLRLIEQNFKKAEEDFQSITIQKGISSISELVDFDPILEIVNEEERIFKVKLINFQNYELDQIARLSFELFCNEQNIKTKPGGYSFDQNIYRVEIPSLDSLNSLKDFEGLFSVEDMPIYDLIQDEFSIEETVDFKVPEENKSYPLVGVLDTGIEKIPQLEPWIESKNHTNIPSEYVHKGHGTFVSGVLIYGDELQGENYIGLNGCKVFEAIVFPDLDKTSIREDELIINIEDAIKRNSEIKIWNLSLGSSSEASLLEFSDFGKALDDIQSKYNVLIIKSVGNCRNFEKRKPRGRIARGADSIRSLVVGSITHEKSENDLDAKNNPSPFTRIGPGPAYLNKPDVVHYGGNAGLHAGRTTINGVKSFGIDGKVKKLSGTSFATPRVTGLAAGLNHALNETFNSSLIKALIIHSSKHPDEMKMEISDKIRMTGFGKPAGIDDILFNEPNEITLILQDTLEKNSYINILDFPYPQSMVDEEGYYYGEITVTLVTDPILEAKQQGLEYCQSNIDVFLGTYNEKVDRDTSKALIKNPIGTDKGNKNLLSDALYSKRVINDLENSFQKERVLLSYGKKYQPVKKWVINLDELRDSNRENFLKAPKQWYLKLNGVYRDFIESQYERNQQVPSQDFCLIITIKDTKKHTDIYSEVSQLLDSYQFLHSNVRLRDSIKVNLNN